MAAVWTVSRESPMKLLWWTPVPPTALREVARQYTDAVYPYQWTDDFRRRPKLRVFQGDRGLSLLWLDADDLLLQPDREKFLSLKETLPLSGPGDDAVSCSLDSAGNPTFSYYRERLLKITPVSCGEGKVHEVITPGVIVYSDIGVTPLEDPIWRPGPQPTHL